jgi:hypothetical protein
MGNTAYGLGLAIILVAAGALILSGKFRETSKFDERQRILRYRAYQAAFWVLVAYTCINSFLSTGAGIAWADDFTGTFTGVCVAITVFVVICIRYDAYFAINQKPGFYFILFSVLAVVNLGFGIINVFDDGAEFFTGGLLNFHAMSFIVVAMFIAILTALAIRRLKAKAQSETD